MLPLGVTKVTHHHQPEDKACCASDPENDADDHDIDHCLVCHFILSPFLACEFSAITYFLPAVTTGPVVFLSDPVLRVAHSFHLRAPPVA